jgi:molecular chaperone DnaJ
MTAVTYTLVINMSIDPFEILGIGRDASPDEIKRAFRRLAKKYHPDITGGPDERFRRVLIAYEQLTGRSQAPEAADSYDYYMRVEIDRERNRVQDLFDDFRDGFLTLFDLDAPEFLDLFVELTPAEAARGGRLKLDLPLVRKCRTCMGFGKPFWKTCSRCGGTGEEEYRKAAVVDIPPHAADGWRTRVHLDNLHLTVIFKIAQQGK